MTLIQRIRNINCDLSVPITLLTIFKVIKNKIKEDYDIALLESDISEIIEEIEKTCNDEYIQSLMSVYKIDRESTREMMKSLPDKYMTLIENVSKLILPLKDDVEKILEYKSII